MNEEANMVSDIYGIASKDVQQALTISNLCLKSNFQCTQD